MTMNTKSKKKIALLYVEMTHYREPVFEALGKKCELTVFHPGPKKYHLNDVYKEVLVPCKSIGGFYLQFGLLQSIKTGNFDAAIFMFDLRWLSILWSFLRCPVRTKRITWGFWMTKKKFANLVRIQLAKLADGNVFYADGAANDFLSVGLSKERVFIARNTISVHGHGRDSKAERMYLLFLGSFDQRKRNDVTIAAFNEACSLIPPNINLVLVGDGQAKNMAVLQAAKSRNSKRIFFEPGTFDLDEINEYYRHAIITVSFGQAGLSVLQSFGHGVPFLTNKHAVSGGEIENIVHNETGLLCDSSQQSLTDEIVRICNDPALAENLGINSIEYYKTKASVEKMVGSFICAIENALDD